MMIKNVSEIFGIISECNTFAAKSEQIDRKSKDNMANCKLYNQGLYQSEY